MKSNLVMVERNLQKTMSDADQSERRLVLDSSVVRGLVFMCINHPPAIGLLGGSLYSGNVRFLPLITYYTFYSILLLILVLMPLLLMIILIFY